MSYGREDYIPYYYLWHLIAIGVLKARKLTSETCPRILRSVWDDRSLRNGRDGVKVALIDMGIASCHPNLEPKQGSRSQVLWNEALDLASHRYGVKTNSGGPNSHLETRAQHLTGINVGLVQSPTPDESELLNTLKNGLGVTRQVMNYQDRYASHGTSCAGLVCGTSYRGDQFGNEGNAIAYYGVDPFSQIVPITTSISPDPEQLIAAFLYAHSLDADVILFPRDAANPNLASIAKIDKEEKTRLDSAADHTLAWALLDKVIHAVSMDIPVVCAAGNDGRSDLIYPASLAKIDGNGVIAVGAVSHAAYRSGYSNYGDGLTVVAPSDDGEVYNRHQIRLDKKSPDILDFWVDGVHQNHTPEEIPYSAERLVSLDVPGPRGYAAAGREGPVRNREEAIGDPGARYTEFGGTSGAAALVAGVVALMQRQQQQRLSGPVVKERMVSGPTNVDVSHWYWLNGVSSLQPDSINSGPPSNPQPSELFGDSGLLDAQHLLNIRL